jgi:hypothetical protein
VSPDLPTSLAPKPHHRAAARQLLGAERVKARDANTLCENVAVVPEPRPTKLHARVALLDIGAFAA